MAVVDVDMIMTTMMITYNDGDKSRYCKLVSHLLLVVHMCKLSTHVTRSYCLCIYKWFTYIQGRTIFRVFLQLDTPLNPGVFVYNEMGTLHAALSLFV